jgi:hypothetical protein
LRVPFVISVNGMQNDGVINSHITNCYYEHFVLLIDLVLHENEAEGIGAIKLASVNLGHLEENDMRNK